IGDKGQKLVNNDFHIFFPAQVMPFSGMGYGDVEGLDVEANLMLRIGESYYLEQDSKRRKEILEAAIDKAHDLKMGAKTNDDDTLKNERMNDKLRGLKKADMAAAKTDAENYSKNTKASTGQLQEFLESGQVISTPLLEGGKVQRDPISSDIEGVFMDMGTFFIQIKPDQKTDKPGKGARTDLSSDIANKALKYSFDNKGIVTKLVNFPVKVTVTIQTFYNKESNPDSNSGYGRGTTEQDKKRGATTLRFHEGSHGKDYIDYLKANPLPLFKVGMTKSSLLKGMDALTKASDYSNKHTDEVGSPTEKEYKSKSK
ncbi:MAG: hypothetical protein Q8K60_08160, partial [Parachlamydiaceae bacterium]|nr:hypothetical protein [Parachlamydiaceae bacterium]